MYKTLRKEAKAIVECPTIFLFKDDIERYYRMANKALDNNQITEKQYIRLAEMVDNKWMNG